MTERLSELKPGTTARILGFTSSDEAGAALYVEQVTRLGLTPGTTFRLVRRAPLGDPVEIRLRGYSLALRPHEADALQVQVIE